MTVLSRQHAHKATQKLCKYCSNKVPQSIFAADTMALHYRLLALRDMEA
jgi:hypothetical protein